MRKAHKKKGDTRKASEAGPLLPGMSRREHFIAGYQFWLMARVYHVGQEGYSIALLPGTVRHVGGGKLMAEIVLGGLMPGLQSDALWLDEDNFSMLASRSVPRE